MIDPATTLAVALLAGVVCHVVARRFGLPSIALLFAVGIGLGPDGLGVVHPQTFGTHLFDVVGLSVAVILFEGGLNLRLRSLRRESAAIRRLVTVGVLFTGTAAGLCAFAFLDWPWRTCALFGALVVVTGPTVIRPVLRHARVRSRPATILEAEGVFNDPIGAILAAVTLQVVARPASDVVDASLPPLLLRLALGVGAGGLFALGLHFAQQRAWLPHDTRKIATLAAVLMLFETCESILSESGVVAVTVAGGVAANLGSDLRSELSDFKEQLSLGLIGLLFILLAADVRLADIADLGSTGWLTVAVVVFGVRPACVFLSLAGLSVPLREKLFLSWMGPRGIVAAALTSLATVHMDATGLDGGASLRALVFLTIGVSVVVQGGTASLVARALGLQTGARDRVVIFGASEIGLLLAAILRDGGRRVTLIEPDPHDVRRAREKRFDVVYGNELDPRTMARAGLGEATIAVAATERAAENALFVRAARERFGVEETYAAIDTSDRGVTAAVLNERGDRVLFGGEMNAARWNRRLRQNETDRLRLYFDAAPDTVGSELPAGAVLVAVGRDGVWQPLYPEFAARSGDVAIAVVLRSDRAATLSQLKGKGWRQSP